MFGIEKAEEAVAAVVAPKEEATPKAAPAENDEKVLDKQFLTEGDGTHHNLLPEAPVEAGPKEYKLDSPIVVRAGKGVVKGTEEDQAV